MRDDLDEIIKANHVRVIVGEWIPFGANQISNLNEKMGSVERVQGGLFSAVVDDMPQSTRFQHSVTATGNLIKVLDYDLAGHVNLTADIYFEEESGIVQVRLSVCCYVSLSVSMYAVCILLKYLSMNSVHPSMLPSHINWIQYPIPTPPSVPCCPPPSHVYPCSSIL